MLRFTWQLLKAFRYLLPYLNEVSDERYCVDDNDRLKAKRIRDLVRMVLWRIILFIVFTGLIFWVVMPLHARNAVLQQELTNRDNRVTAMHAEIKDLMGTIRKTERELDRYKLSYENKTAEVEQLSDLFAECKDVNDKILSVSNRSETQVKSTTSSKATNNKGVTNNKTTQSSQQKSLPALSEEFKNKLKKYNEQ